MRLGIISVFVFSAALATIIQCKNKNEEMAGTHSPILNPSFEICNDDPIPGLLVRFHVEHKLQQQANKIHRFYAVTRKLFHGAECT